MKLSVVTILVGVGLLSIASGGLGQVNPGTPWPATDALGRQLPTAEEVGPPRPGRQVAIFYFLTHQGYGKNARGDGPYDVSRILAQDPEALKNPDSPLWGPIGSTHYWGEPLYGYYRSDDPWVLRRHAHLLADAGIDTLIFDTTNAVTYADVYMKICEVFRQVRCEGGRTPQIAFMVNTEANATALRLYHDFYQRGLYRELWFTWQGKPLLIVDQFDEEFSRDIEPMRGGHGDNYYWQLVAGVRRYKGAPAIPKASAPAMIRIEGSFEQWRDVGPEFTGHVGDCVPRDCDGTAGLHYTNRTGRNELLLAKVARDDRNVYFYLRTRDAIVPTGRMEGLWLFLKTGQNVAASWEGCNFLVGRLSESDGVWLEENTGGWNWKKVVKVPYRVAGSELQVAIPRAALHLAKPGAAVSFDFKWADNLQRPGDVTDFYLSGDTAPAGRFFYRYVAE